MFVFIALGSDSKCLSHGLLCVTNFALGDEERKFQYIGTRMMFWFWKIWKVLATANILAANTSAMSTIVRLC